MKRRESPHVSDIVVLTAQQARVLGLWTQGHTRAEIATEMGVSGSTVYSHFHRVMWKLGQAQYEARRRVARRRLARRRLARRRLARPPQS
jgi:DNA-binding CsgD family transcriptional regulator